MNSVFKKVVRWQYLWLCIFVVSTFAMHLTTIINPNDMVLDEQHYIKDARSVILTHFDQRPEHPPLAKVFIVAGIEWLGDNPWGWRMPSIILGTLAIIFFFFICRRLDLSPIAVNLATFFFAFENISFLHAGIAMLDVFSLSLMLAFFLLYLSREFVASGIFIGLSALAKLYGALGSATIFIHWIFSKKQMSKWFVLTIIFAPISFIAFMPLFDYALNHQFLNPITRIKDMMSLSGSLTFASVTHPSISRPWSWIVNYIPMAYWYGPHYTAVVSFTIWLAIFPVVLYMLYRAIKRNEAGLFGFAWFFGTFLLWIPLSIITNRVSFIFYFYPAVGAFCLGLGAAYSEIITWARARKKLVQIPVAAGLVIFILLHALAFVMLSPVFLRT